MLRFRKLLPLVALVALLFGAANADAAFATRFASGVNVLLVVDGSAQDSDPDPTRIAVNPTNALVIAFQAAAGFQVTGSTFSFRNGTGAGGNSLLTEAQTEVTRTAAGAATITVTTGFDGYTLPVGSTLNIDSTVAFSGIQTTGASTYEFRNWADNVPPAQNLVVPTGVSATTGVFALTTQIPPGSVPSLTTPRTEFNRTTTPFQVTQRSTIALGGLNDFISFTATTVISAVPVPAGLVLALTGMPVFGIGAWIRRRRGQAKV